MIEVKNLSKSYGSKLAVDGISFTAGESEILGFLGPNGAGKSTTMNMLTGYLSSSADRRSSTASISWRIQCAQRRTSAICRSFLRCTLT